jgi:23S rRNA (cytidine1920-2'-O)/16S rRNA (cytidine1409-2'-O)-methyltransferase
VAKKRLDILLVEKGFYPSREKARTAIMDRKIKVNGIIIDKAGTNVADDVEIIKLGKDLPYVSRGGLKLEKALSKFKIDLKDKVVLDVGASTGGFTHCALLKGASKVFAVDVGYGQLAWELRQDPRVVPMERFNVRYLTIEKLGQLVDVCTIDVSFISLKKVLPAIIPCLKPDGEIIALIKPQFEAGRDKVGKKGVVRDPQVHQDVIESVLLECVSLNVFPVGLTYSPIKGPEGNIEYLLWIKKFSQEQTDFFPLVKKLVYEAHIQL